MLTGASFTNDVVGPFHQGNVDRNRAPLRVPTAQIRLRDPTGPGAGSSREYRDVFGHNLCHGLAQRRPSDRFDRLDRGLAHQVRCIVSEEYLHVVPSLGQRKPVAKNKRRAGRLIGPPGTPHQNVQFFLRRLSWLRLCLAGGSGNGRRGKSTGSQLRRFFKKISAGSHAHIPQQLPRNLHERGMIANYYWQRHQATKPVGANAIRPVK
jgi:hypothetical protein